MYIDLVRSQLLHSRFPAAKHIQKNLHKQIMASAFSSLSSPFFGPKFAVDAPPSPPTCVRFRSSTPRVSASCASAEKSRIHIASPASLYEVLGIQMGATCQEIKGAYRRLARVLHPDVASNGQKDTSADEFMKVHAAYATLSDPKKRADYDRTLFMRRKQLSSQFAMSSSSTVATTSRFSGYKRPTWETDQCW